MAKYLFILPLIASAGFTISWMRAYIKFHDNVALIMAGMGLYLTLFMCFLAFILENNK